MAKDKPEENGEKTPEDEHPTCEIDPENGGGSAANGDPEQEADFGRFRVQGDQSNSLTGL